MKKIEELTKKEKINLVHYLVEKFDIDTDNENSVHENIRNFLKKPELKETYKEYKKIFNLSDEKFYNKLNELGIYNTFMDINKINIEIAKIGDAVLNDTY